jgi:transcriptional regulator with GAF, ATPase, and Fis domain
MKEKTEKTDAQPESMMIADALRAANGDIPTAAHSVGMRPREFGEAMSENKITLRNLDSAHIW